jgi:hypothetical protein
MNVSWSLFGGFAPLAKNAATNDKQKGGTCGYKAVVVKVNTITTCFFGTWINYLLYALSVT